MAGMCGKMSMAIMLWWLKLFTQFELITGLSVNKFVDYFADQLAANIWLKLIKLLFEFLAISLMYLNFQFSTHGQHEDGKVIRLPGGCG